jgi:hypothetical protein
LKLWRDYSNNPLRWGDDSVNFGFFDNSYQFASRWLQ